MNIGVPKERRPFEFRVGLSPVAVNLLTAEGHRCFVEAGAGLLITPAMKYAVVFLVYLVVVLWRPQGLLGRF